MARQCKNCNSVLCSSSEIVENGIKFLKCPICHCKIQLIEKRGYSPYKRPLQTVYSKQTLSR